jgi:hypothetical protein
MVECSLVVLFRERLRVRACGRLSNSQAATCYSTRAPWFRAVSRRGLAPLGSVPALRGAGWMARMRPTLLAPRLRALCGTRACFRCKFEAW